MQELFPERPSRKRELLGWRRGELQLDGKSFALVFASGGSFFIRGCRAFGSFGGGLGIVWGRQLELGKTQVARQVEAQAALLSDARQSALSSWRMLAILSAAIMLRAAAHYGPSAVDAWLCFDCLSFSRSDASSTKANDKLRPGVSSVAHFQVCDAWPANRSFFSGLLLAATASWFQQQLLDSTTLLTTR